MERLTLTKTNSIGLRGHFEIFKHTLEQEIRSLKITLRRRQKSYDYLAENYPDKKGELNRISVNISTSTGKLDYYEKVKSQRISEKVFKYVVKRFNQLVLDVILNNGYIFNLGGHTGAIYIAKKKRIGKNVDWKASNIRKEELIAEGKLPLLGDNGGEAWHIYHVTDFEFWVAWEKNKCTFKGKSQYAFKPTRTDNRGGGFIPRLAAIPYNEKLKRFQCQPIEQ